MINPQSITPTALPSVPLTERKDLPAIPGIYFAIDSQGNVQYIGRSVNIKNRWINHHRFKQLQKLDQVNLAWIPCEKDELEAAEAKLIKRFDPVLNDTKSPDLPPGEIRVGSVSVGVFTADWYRVACSLNGRSLRANVASVITAHIEDNMDEYTKMLKYTAKKNMG